MVGHRVQAAEASRLVEVQLERERLRYAAIYGHCDADLRITSVDEYEMGWLVFYRAAEQIRDAAGCAVLVGHSPYLVDAENAGLFLVPGRAFVTGEWREEYPHRFKGQDRPAPLETAQEIRDVLAAQGRLAAIKYVRARVRLSLEASVALVHSVGRGEPLPAELLERPARRVARKFAAPIQPVGDPPAPDGTEPAAGPTDPHRLVGDFHELSHGRFESPSIRWAVRATAAPHEPDLLRYLRAGTVLAASPGITHDVLGAQDTLIDIGGLCLLTDGTWLWYSDLAYYVEHYHLELDPRFTAHAHSHHWTTPPPAPEDLHKIECTLTRWATE